MNGFKPAVVNPGEIIRYDDMIDHAHLVDTPAVILDGVGLKFDYNEIHEYVNVLTFDGGEYLGCFYEWQTEEGITSDIRAAIGKTEA